MREQFWNDRADLLFTAPELPEPESQRTLVLRPRRHRDVSTPSWEYDMQKGPVFSLLVLVTGGNFGKWRKSQTGSPPVPDSHGLSAKGSTDRYRDYSLGAGILALVIHH